MASNASIARDFLLMLPFGDYTLQELVVKFNMLLQLSAAESKDSSDCLRHAMRSLRRKGQMNLEYLKEGNRHVYRKK